MTQIGAFRVLMRTRVNIEPYSPLKPTMVGFIFIRPNSLSRAKDLAAVIHVTSYHQSWALKSVLRNYGSSRSFKTRGLEVSVEFFHGQMLGFQFFLTEK